MPHPARTTIGHIHLKVRNLARSVEFYTNILQFRVTESVPGQFAFLSGGEAHHELALQQISPDAPQPLPWGTGLYHVAFEVPDRQALADAYQKLHRMGVKISAVDHKISWALYCNDPDGTGLELYLDMRDSNLGVDAWRGESRYLDPAVLTGKPPDPSLS